MIVQEMDVWLHVIRVRRERVISAVILGVNQPAVLCVVLVVGGRVQVDVMEIVTHRVAMNAVKVVQQAMVVHVDPVAVVESVIQIALLRLQKLNRVRQTVLEDVKPDVVIHATIRANQNVFQDVDPGVQVVVTHVQTDV